MKKNQNEDESFIGLWLDHENFLTYIPFSGAKELNKIQTFHADRTKSDKNQLHRFRGEKGTEYHEYHEQKREQNQQKSYFKTVSEIMTPYQHIVVMGPGNFVAEFMNYIHEDKRFNGRDITFKTSGKLDEKSFVNRVEEHFAPRVKLSSN